MNTDVIETLRNYVATEILHGKEMGLDSSTPLLEWGILNSLELARLIAFVHRTYQVEVPFGAVIADNFRDIATIANLVTRLQGAGSDA
jgi:acyl carrier protein